VSVLHLGIPVEAYGRWSIPCAAFVEGVGPFSASVYFLSPTRPWSPWETFVIAVRALGCMILAHDTALGTGAAMPPASRRARVKRRRL
jgi:hypothetical protein